MARLNESTAPVESIEIREFNIRVFYRVDLADIQDYA